MFDFGPIDVVVVGAVLVRRLGLARAVFCGIGLAIAVQPLLPPVSCGCFGPMLRRCDRSRAYYAAVKSDLKNLASQQEIFFSDQNFYTSNTDALAFTESDGVQVTIVASQNGWSAWATHRVLDTDEGCGITWGDPPVVAGPGNGSLIPGQIDCTL